MRKLRWLIKFLSKSLFAVIFLFCLFLLFERVRGQISLAKYKRELISKGEKLNAKDFLASTNNGENGAPEIMEAIKQLKNGQVLPDNNPPAMSSTPSGHAVIGFRENEWSGFGSKPFFHKTTNNWIGLAADLKTNEAALEKIRVALKKPIFNNNLDLAQGPELLLAHLAPEKSLTWWFGAKSQFALRDGKTHEAVDDLLATLQLPRLMADDQIVISELVRIAIMAIDISEVWEAIQADGWSDEDLARLQAACLKPEFIQAMMHALEGERIFADTGYDLFRKSNEETSKALEWESKFAGEEDQRGGMIKFFEKHIYCRIWRFAWSYQDQRQNLEHLQRLVEAARKAGKEKSYVGVLPDIEKSMLEIDKRNWYDRLRFGLLHSGVPLSRSIARTMLVETERSQLVCAIALKHYFLRYKKFPTSLDQMAPEFLTAVPTDYMDGQPMKYHLNSNGSFIVYSVGQNGIDESGDNTPLKDTKNSMNANHLWWRKDMVWPAPANSEEIDAWRKEQTKN